MTPIEACPLCDEVITNPICLDCLEEQLKHWWLLVKDEPLELKELFTGYPEIGTRCIICGENISVCSHCYAKEAWDLIIKNYPELGEEFLIHFNYDLYVPHWSS